MSAAVLNFLIYLGLGALLYRSLGSPGISLTDSVAYTIQAVTLLLILRYRQTISLLVTGTLVRAILGAAVAASGMLLFLQFIPVELPFLSALQNYLFAGLIALGIGVLIVLPWIWRDLRLLLRL